MFDITPPRAIVRADASIATGTGHIMRCLTLANQLKARDWRVTFACTQESVDCVPALGESGFDIWVLSDPHAPDALAEHTEGNYELLLIDHYGLDGAYETACRKFVGRIMAIDDMADRTHDCDVLLDQTYGRLADAYAPLVPDACVLLLGTEYALLRPQFPATRETSLKRREANSDVKRIVISLGGTDPYGVVETVVRAIASLPKTFDVDVVMGSNDRSAQCKEISKNASSTFRFHRFISDMELLLSEADLVIGAAGSSSWERCCLGVPTLMVVMAENQRLISRNLEQAGAATIVGDFDDVSTRSMADAISRMASKPQTLNTMSSAAAAICDGRGAERVIERLAA